jgi:pimeloyl-ACP methyl ester carboxylesterase
LSTAPQWYIDALAVSRADEYVVVDGCRIHYLAWGEPGRRGLVFVHGGAAHAHWWTHVAARFADRYRVVALDMSGHGDSGRRENYALDQWADEVMGVAAAAGMVGRPLIVGHSMGGFVTIVTAARYSEDLAGVIVCDSPVTAPDPEIDAARLGQAFGTPRVYPTEAEALARFRTVPPQDNYLDYVMADVAARSLQTVDGGWSWKYDNRVFEGQHANPRAIAREYLEAITCRLALLRAENGLVTEDIGQFMYEMLGRVNPVIEIPEAGHHLMLDQPLPLLTAIRTLAADWDHSLPHTRG